MPGSYEGFLAKLAVLTHPAMEHDSVDSEFLGHYGGAQIFLDHQLADLDLEVSAVRSSHGLTPFQVNYIINFSVCPLLLYNFHLVSCISVSCISLLSKAQ